MTLTNFEYLQPPVGKVETLWQLYYCPVCGTVYWGTDMLHDQCRAAISFPERAPTGFYPCDGQLVPIYATEQKEGEL